MTAQRSPKRAGKPNPGTRVRRKRRISQDATKLSAELVRELERSQDRYIERWARKLIVVVDGEVRKLTEEQVQNVVRKSRPKAGSGRGQRSSPRASRIRPGIAKKKIHRTR